MTADSVTDQQAISELPMPLIQKTAKCKADDMKMIFYSHANKTHFQKKGFVLSLVLKVRTRKWAICSS